MVSKYMEVIKQSLICLFCIVTVTGCSFFNMFPSKTRDQWYMDHGKAIVSYTEMMRAVKVGMTKEEVVFIVGEPTYKRSVDVLNSPVDEWEYINQYSATRHIISFKNNMVVDIRSR